MQWSHVAATFDPRMGLALYINGQDAGRLPVSGHLVDRGGAFQIGRNLEPIPAAASIKIPASYSFDGIIDELKIYTRALDASEIKTSYESSRPSAPPPLTWRKLPRIPSDRNVLVPSTPARPESSCTGVTRLPMSCTTSASETRSPDGGIGADEYYTIYPDGLAVRHFLVHAPRDRYSITEPATLNNPGERAEDNISIEAATLANMDGETRTFSWDLASRRKHPRRVFQCCPQGKHFDREHQVRLQASVHLRTRYVDHSVRRGRRRDSSRLGGDKS